MNIYLGKKKEEEKHKYNILESLYFLILRFSFSDIHFQLCNTLKQS